MSQSRPQVALRPTPDGEPVRAFDRGWLRPDGSVDPYLSYSTASQAVNWSQELEELHEESTREHFIDVWTRRSMLERLGPLPPSPVIVDLGCSTGYLLEELATVHPDGSLIGVDLVASGLRKAHRLAPTARLLLADVCALPIEDSSVDAAVSANLLEHVPDDGGALAELRRVLRPGARAVIVVPAGPGLYDYYDRFLGHERRYSRGELGTKAREVGLEVLSDGYLGSVLYPAFWLVKQRNRRLYKDLEGEALEARVAGDIARTGHSRIGHLTELVERALVGLGIRLPFGIREVTVLRRPAESMS